MGWFWMLLLFAAITVTGVIRARQIEAEQQDGEG